MTFAPLARPRSEPDPLLAVCPQTWLTDVLTRLPTTRNREIDSLLPIEGWAAVSG